MDDPAAKRLPVERPPLAPPVREGDVVRAPWPAVPIAAIDPADIAAVASVLLTRPGHEGAALTLSGPQPLTPGEQVAALGRALRRPLRYEPLSDDEARASMADDSTPASFIDAFFRFFSAGEFDDSAVTTTVHEITGRPPPHLRSLGARSRRPFR